MKQYIPELKNNINFLNGKLVKYIKSDKKAKKMINCNGHNIIFIIEPANVNFFPSGYSVYLTNNNYSVTCAVFDLFDFELTY